MKALAAEMTANFGKKLQPLGILVRELTGDMQLTKKEIQETQVNFISLTDNLHCFLTTGFVVICLILEKCGCLVCYNKQLIFFVQTTLVMYVLTFSKSRSNFVSPKDRMFFY